MRLLYNHLLSPSLERPVINRPNNSDGLAQADQLPDLLSTSRAATKKYPKVRTKKKRKKSSLKTSSKRWVRNNPKESRSRKWVAARKKVTKCLSNLVNGMSTALFARTVVTSSVAMDVPMSHTWGALESRKCERTKTGTATTARTRRRQLPRSNPSKQNLRPMASSLKASLPPLKKKSPHQEEGDQSLTNLLHLSLNPPEEWADVPKGQLVSPSPMWQWRSLTWSKVDLNDRRIDRNITESLITCAQCNLYIKFHL